MPPKKTPTSSLTGGHVAYSMKLHLTVFTPTVAKLFTMRIWYRTQAAIRKKRSGGVPPETPTTRSFIVIRLPQEVVELIIAHLTYDIPSLRVCSLTCYSWYIATVPLLHHALLIYKPHRNRECYWPNAIHRMHKLGLLPFVKELRIRANSTRVGLTAKLFNRRTLRQFTTLASVQDLSICNLDIPSFVPRIRQYFGHFLPTVRSLVLASPKGSHRHIILFIGLFERLEHLDLRDSKLGAGETEPGDDLTLVPTSAPPLRGRLTVWRVKRDGLFKKMIQLFGGIQFRSMNLFDVDETRLLLKACAKTLVQLQFHPSDPRGE